LNHCNKVIVLFHLLRRPPPFGMEPIPHLEMLRIFIICSLTNFTNASLWIFGTHRGSNMRK
jgi:hypothetical protein